jgi:hypothetical protein
LICTFSVATRDDLHRGSKRMLKTPVGLVTVALTAAILLAGSLLIVTGTRGENRAPHIRLVAPAK